MPDSGIRTKHELEYLSLISRIGSGGFANVFQVVSISRAYFTVKIFKSRGVDSDAAIKRETKILSQINHVGVICSIV